jgi:hypothetical protein
MPGFPVLTTLQPIVGFDMHKAIPPPTPPPPMVPHVVVWGVGLSQKTSFQWAISTSKASSPESGCAKPVLVGMGHACGRQHDAGPHPGHIWPNVLLPLILLGSASKAEFGSSTVKIAVSPIGGGSADMGINVAYVMNTNLDCYDAPLPPCPTGFAITLNYSVMAGFSLKDFLHGLLQLVADSFLTWFVGMVCSGLGSAVSDLLSGEANQVLKNLGKLFGFDTAKVLMSDGAGFFASSGRLFVDGWGAVLPAAVNAFKNGTPTMVGNVLGAAVSTFGLGTPIGYAPQNAPVGGEAPGTANFWASSKINKLFE